MAILDDDVVKFTLGAIGVLSSALWVLSEIIGYSKCKSNGVIEFILNGFCIEVRYHNISTQVDEENDEENDEACALLS